YAPNFPVSAALGAKRKNYEIME
ncbi:hypothetical protein MGSAQ_001585, partial [marine sediment metagenome]